MLKKLRIDIFDEYGILKKKIICGHLDCTKSITILSECEINIANPNNLKDLIIPDQIDHFNVFECMITIYYKSGHYIEITRPLND